MKTSSQLVVAIVASFAVCSAMGRHPMPSRAHGPIPGARHVIERMCDAAGGTRRWNRTRTISLNVLNRIPPRRGRPEQEWEEHIFGHQCRHGFSMLLRRLKDGVRTDYGLDGTRVWVAVDGRPKDDVKLLDEAFRRLREAEFWLRFPFILREEGTEIDVAGQTVLDGGRRPCWIIDVLPSRRGPGWPEGRLRLLVDMRTWLVAAIIHPRVPGELFPFRSVLSNVCTLQGFSAAHERRIYDEEGLAGVEIVRERLYDVNLPTDLFFEPRFRP